MARVAALGSCVAAQEVTRDQALRLAAFVIPAVEPPMDEVTEMEEG